MRRLLMAGVMTLALYSVSQAQIDPRWQAFQQPPGPSSAGLSTEGDWFMIKNGKCYPFKVTQQIINGTHNVSKDGSVKLDGGPYFFQASNPNLTPEEECKSQAQSLTSMAKMRWVPVVPLVLMQGR